MFFLSFGYFSVRKCFFQYCHIHVWARNAFWATCIFGYSKRCISQKLNALSNNPGLTHSVATTLIRCFTLLCLVRNSSNFSVASSFVFSRNTQTHREYSSTIPSTYCSPFLVGIFSGPAKSDHNTSYGAVALCLTLLGWLISFSLLIMHASHMHLVKFAIFIPVISDSFIFANRDSTVKPM